MKFHGILVMPSLSNFACKSEMGWVKCDSWTWKSDFKYYWFWMPVNEVRLILGWLLHAETRREVDLIGIIGLAQGRADARCGRMYHFKMSGRKQTP